MGSCAQKCGKKSHTSMKLSRQEGNYWLINRKEKSLKNLNNNQFLTFTLDLLEIYPDSSIGNLSNSQLFILGGTTSTSHLSSACYLVSTQDLKIKLLSNLPHPSKSGSLYGYKGFVYYLFGIGQNSSEDLTEIKLDFMRYDLRNNQWEILLNSCNNKGSTEPTEKIAAQKPKIHSKSIFKDISNPITALLDSSLYILGGRDSGKNNRRNKNVFKVGLDSLRIEKIRVAYDLGLKKSICFSFDNELHVFGVKKSGGKQEKVSGYKLVSECYFEKSEIFVDTTLIDLSYPVINRNQTLLVFNGEKVQKLVKPNKESVFIEILEEKRSTSVFLIEKTNFVKHKTECLLDLTNCYSLDKDQSSSDSDSNPDIILPFKEVLKNGAISVPNSENVSVQSPLKPNEPNNFPEIPMKGNKNLKSGRVPNQPIVSAANSGKVKQVDLCATENSFYASNEPRLENLKDSELSPVQNKKDLKKNLMISSDSSSSESISLKKFIISSSPSMPFEVAKDARLTDNSPINPFIVASGSETSFTYKNPSIKQKTPEKSIPVQNLKLFNPKKSLKSSESSDSIQSSNLHNSNLPKNHSGMKSPSILNQSNLNELSLSFKIHSQEDDSRVTIPLEDLKKIIRILCENLNIPSLQSCYFSELLLCSKINKTASIPQLKFLIKKFLPDLNFKVEKLRNLFDDLCAELRKDRMIMFDFEEVLDSCGCKGHRKVGRMKAIEIVGEGVRFILIRI